jgi:hypothetical protein
MWYNLLGNGAINVRDDNLIIVAPLVYMTLASCSALIRCCYTKHHLIGTFVQIQACLSQENLYRLFFCLNDAFLTLSVLLMIHFINSTEACDKLIQFSLQNYAGHCSLSEVYLKPSCIDVFVFITTPTDTFSYSFEINGSG